MQTAEPFVYRLRDFQRSEATAALCLPPPLVLPPVRTDGDYGGIGWKVIVPPVPVQDAAASPPRRGGIREALGLSQGHKCTLPFVLEVAEGGGRLTVRQPSSKMDIVRGREGGAEEGDEPVNLLKVLRGIYDSPEEVEEAGKRGRISEWSRSSRHNFRRFLGGMMLNALEGAMFVGLTYPSEFPEPESHEVYKGHLRAFKARLARWCPGAAFVWKLEFQRRGAAHYHLVVFGVGQDQEALQRWRDWADRAWYEVVGSGDVKHLAAGVTSEFVKSTGGAVGYLANYLGDDDQTRPGDFTGRYWGVFNKPLLPMAPVSKIEISDREAFLIRRVQRKLMEKKVNEGRRRRLVKQLGFWADVGASWMDVEAWYSKPGCDRFLHGVVGQWGGPSRLTLPNHAVGDDPFAKPLPFRMPRKYRARNNFTVTLFCDASAISGKLLRWVKATPLFLDLEKCPF